MFMPWEQQKNASISADAAGIPLHPHIRRKAPALISPTLENHDASNRLTEKSCSLPFLLEDKLRIDKITVSPDKHCEPCKG